MFSSPLWNETGEWKQSWFSTWASLISAPFTSHYISKDQKYIFIFRTYLGLVKCIRLEPPHSEQTVVIFLATFHWLSFCINDGDSNMLPINLLQKNHATKTALILSTYDFYVLMGMSHTQRRAEWPLKCFHSISPGGWLCPHNHNKAMVF